VDGKYGLQLRDKHVEVAPDSWGFFGGSIEDGETAVQTVRRELLEELEIELLAPVLFMVVEHWAFFTIDATGQWPGRLHEGQRAAVFSYDESLMLKKPQIVADVLAEHRRANEGAHGSRD